MARVINFLTPITETSSKGKDFIIRGEAIHATTTMNGHTFTVEELSRSAGTLANKPLLKDHINSVDAIVGRVLKASYNQSRKCVDFEARVTDTAVKEKIIDGVLASVSVGASVEEIIEQDNGNYILKGLTFLELSTVAIPADPNAGFNFAIAVVASMQGQKPKSPLKPRTTQEEFVTRLKAIHTEVQFLQKDASKHAPRASR